LYFKNVKSTLSSSPTYMTQCKYPLHLLRPPVDIARKNIIDFSLLCRLKVMCVKVRRSDSHTHYHLN